MKSDEGAEKNPYCHAKRRLSFSKRRRLFLERKCTLLPLAKVSESVPTGVTVTFAGKKGTALNAGPLVRYNGPEYAPGPLLGAVPLNHSGEPSKS